MGKMMHFISIFFLILVGLFNSCMGNRLKGDNHVTGKTLGRELQIFLQEMIMVWSGVVAVEVVRSIQFIHVL